MRKLVFALLATTTLGFPSPVPGQHAHGDLNQRGAAVMGFDQELTTHHFTLFADGGSIEVTVKRDDDRTNLTAIQSHLPHIAQMFAAGHFDAPMLVHDRAHVPGTSVMNAAAAEIRYQYVPLPTGGRVDIYTNDPEVLAAVHAFLKFQIADHATGDSETIMKR